MRSTLKKVWNALSQGPLQVKQLTPTLTKHLHQVIDVHNCFQVMPFHSEQQYPYMKIQLISSSAIREFSFQQIRLLH